MSKNGAIGLAITAALVASSSAAGAQASALAGFYQIVSGTYTECCSKGGEFNSSLPNPSQGFVRLRIDPQNGLATLTFMRNDTRTVWSIVPCPGGDPIPFSFDHGLSRSNGITFHADPGPTPNAVYWNYSVSNSAGRLYINGTLGTAKPDCVDVATQFSHSNVLAVRVPEPKIRISEFSNEGTLLFIQGNAGWTNVVEASMDLVHWTAISTNLMPASLCPICPYILVRDRDAASANLPHRFYRCVEFR